jgi:hypothetical protein
MKVAILDERDSRLVQTTLSGNRVVSARSERNLHSFPLYSAINRSEIMASTLNPMKNMHDEKPSNLGEPFVGPVDPAKDVVSSLGEKVKDTASSVAQSAEDAAAYVGRKADDATTAVGDGLRSLGNTIRAHTSHDGAVGEASSAVANTLESTGRYLQEEGLKGMTDEVTNLIRRNPIPALLVAFGAGFLIARATTSRS